MLIIPTMNDWFQLVRKYSKYRRTGIALLKDYGVMQCIDYIAGRYADGGKDVRILEFGHGFNPDVMAFFQDKHEVWGADRDQKLSYFGADFDWEGRFARDVAPFCKNVRFSRELLATNEESALPDNYFDVALSISILEEVSIPVVGDILTRVYQKLRTGGVVIGTHDLRLRGAEERLTAYIETQRNVGFRLDAQPPYATYEYLDVLVENPASVMLLYEGGVPDETRKYWGHYGTVFTVASKP
jgi:hypothetical protein